MVGVGQTRRTKVRRNLDLKGWALMLVSEQRSDLVTIMLE